MTWKLRPPFTLDHIRKSQSQSLLRFASCLYCKKHNFLLLHNPIISEGPRIQSPACDISSTYLTSFSSCLCVALPCLGYYATLRRPTSFGEAASRNEPQPLKNEHLPRHTSCGTVLVIPIVATPQCDNLRIFFHSYGAPGKLKVDASLTESDLRSPATSALITNWVLGRTKTRPRLVPTSRTQLDKQAQLGISSHRALNFFKIQGGVALPANRPSRWAHA